MKSLDKIDFESLASNYNALFKSLIGENCIENIKLHMQEKEKEYDYYLKKDYKVIGIRGNRDPKEWGNKVMRGWYGEELFKETLKKNPSFQEVIPWGGDKAHSFVIDTKKKELRIIGIKSTEPDLLGKLKIGDDLSIEIKLAAKGKFSIKKTNVDSLYREAALTNRVGLILMLDIVKGLYIVKNVLHFDGKTAYPNQSMEGQPCFEFPKPRTPINYLLEEDFGKFIDPQIFNLPRVKQLRCINIAKENRDKCNASTMKNKIRIDENTKAMEKLKKEITELEIANPDTKKPWEHWYAAFPKSMLPPILPDKPQANIIGTKEEDSHLDQELQQGSLWELFDGFPKK
jgi:hypothetical protein